MVHAAVEGPQGDLSLEHQLAADQLGFPAGDIRVDPQNLRHGRLAAGEIQLVLKLEALLRHRDDKVPFRLLLFFLHHAGLQHAAGHHQRILPVGPHRDLIVHPDQHFPWVDRLGLRRQNPRDRHHVALGGQPLLIDAALKVQVRPQTVDVPVILFRQVENPAADPPGQRYRPL